MLCHLQSWLNLINYRIYHVAAPYSVLRPPGTIAGCREMWIPTPEWPVGLKWRGTRMHTTEKFACCILHWIITTLGKYFWCCLLKKNSLWCFLPCYSNLASSSLAVGDVAGDAPVLLEGLAVGRGWRALFITCPTCLGLDLIWPPGLI